MHPHPAYLGHAYADFVKAVSKVVLTMFLIVTKIIISSLCLIDYQRICTPMFIAPESTPEAES